MKTTKTTKTEPERDMRNISRCWQYSGWHAHGAGPCFDTYEEAIAYRDYYDKYGWESARRRWGTL
jgi:hypothetical protein